MNSVSVKKIAVTLATFSTLFALTVGCRASMPTASAVKAETTSLVTNVKVVLTLKETAAIKTDLKAFEAASQSPLLTKLYGAGLETTSALAAVGTIIGNVQCRSLDLCQETLQAIKAIDGVADASFDSAFTLDGGTVTSEIPLNGDLIVSASVLVTLDDASYQAHESELQAFSDATERPLVRSLFESGVVLSQALPALSMAVAYIRCSDRSGCDQLLRSAKANSNVQAIEYDAMATLEPMPPALSETITARYEAIACAGGCPGLAFNLNGQRIWVDATNLTLSDLQDGTPYKLTGKMENQEVFSPTGPVFLDIFVATSIVEIP